MSILEFHAYDSSDSFLAVLDGARDLKYVAQLNDTGSGQFAIHADDSKATTANLAIRNVIKVVLDNQIIGAFLIEDLTEDLVSDAEEAGREIQVSGRGLLALLSDCIIYPGNLEEFSTGRREYPSIGQAAVFSNLWDEWTARGGGGLSPSFFFFEDSDAEVWPGIVAISLETGQTLLEVCRRLSAYGNFDLTAKHDKELEGLIYKGSDLTSTIQVREGVDILRARRLLQGQEIYNVSLGEGAGQFLQNLDSDSVSAYGRRETYLPIRNALEPTFVTLANQLLLAQYADPLEMIELEIRADRFLPGIDYDIGDTVQVIIPGEIDGAYRIISWGIFQGQAGPQDLRITLVLNSARADYLSRLQRALEAELSGIHVSAGSTSRLAAGGFPLISSDGSITARLFVGRVEGPHQGLWRRRLDTPSGQFAIWYQSADTAGTPWFSSGSWDYVTNSQWWRLGYEGYPQIRLKAPTATSEDPEEHRGVEIDAEGLVGVIPEEVMAASGGGGGGVDLIMIQVFC